jgi:hypothetical protein
MLSSYVAFIVLADDAQLAAINNDYADSATNGILLNYGEIPSGADIDGDAFKLRVTELLTKNAAGLFAE